MSGSLMTIIPPFDSFLFSPKIYGKIHDLLNFGILIFQYTVLQYIFSFGHAAC